MSKKPKIKDLPSEYIDPLAELESPQEAAFAESTTGGDFMGEELEPWSVQRQAAAQRMGLRYGPEAAAEVTYTTITDPATGEPVMRGDEPAKLPVYPGMMGDIIIYLWLCSSPLTEAHRAYRKPEEAWTKAMTWAEKRGISYNSESYWQGYGLFATAMAQVTNSSGRYTGDSKGGKS
jgi:hypothetical protein